MRTDSGASEGNKELESRGALPWPLPKTVEELKQALNPPGLNAEGFSADSHLPLFAMEKH